MARTLAHEGNPRTNSLAVSGTLDGEIVITVEGGSPFPNEPASPIPPSEGVPIFNANHASKYEITSDFAWAHRALISDNLYSVPWDNLTTFSGSYKEYSSLNGISMYGIMYEEVPLAVTSSRYHQFGTTAPVYAYNHTDYMTSAIGLFKDPSITPLGIVGHIGYMTARITNITGTPIFGIATLVQWNPDDPLQSPIRDHFTGYVYVVNTVAGVVEMRYFQNASLSDHNNGILLESSSFTPSVGSVLRLESWSSYPVNANFTGAIWVLSGQYASSETLSNAYMGSFEGGSVENAGDTRGDNTYALGNYAGIVNFPSYSGNIEDSVSFDRVLWKSFTQWA